MFLKLLEYSIIKLGIVKCGNDIPRKISWTAALVVESAECTIVVSYDLLLGSSTTSSCSSSEGFLGRYQRFVSIKGMISSLVSSCGLVL